jgi:hypothetical protein
MLLEREFFCAANVKIPAQARSNGPSMPKSLSHLHKLVYGPHLNCETHMDGI